MTHGGKRLGAGRPKGSGKFKEPTRPVRLPESKIVEFSTWLLEKELSSGMRVTDIWTFDMSRKIEIPLFMCSVEAGIPSQVEDYLEGMIDLNGLLVRSPASTYCVKAKGFSMIGAGIHDGDLLIVDQSIEPTNGKVVIISVNGEMTVKRLIVKGKDIFLQPENEDYAPIQINEFTECKIWGVVAHVIHSDI